MASYENGGQLRQAGRAFPQEDTGGALAPERTTIGSLLEQLKKQAALLENNTQRIANSLGGSIPSDPCGATKSPSSSVEQQLYEIGSLISGAITSSERAINILGA